jgi:hypothetical protein
MCLSTPKAPPPKPTIAPPPPPEKAPAELENAVDSNANLLTKKKKGAKGAFGKGTASAQYSGKASGSGLSINK